MIIKEIVDQYFDPEKEKIWHSLACCAVKKAIEECAYFVEFFENDTEGITKRIINNTQETIANELRKVK